MDRLEAMTFLVEAVDSGSLSAAARKLRTPLATMSRKVSDLESRLGTRLLNRSSRRLTLTDAGRSYVEACRRILEDVHEAERAAAGEYSVPRGVLIVSAPIVFGRMHALPIVVEFLREYLEIDVRLVLTDRIVSLLEEHVDLAIRIGALRESSLIAARVGSIRLVATASPAYFAARGVPRKPGELKSHDCVTFEGLARSDAWTFKQGDSDVTVPVRSRLVVSTAEAALDAAAAGVGITRVLSYQAANAIHMGALALALRDFEPEPWPVSLVYADRRVPAKVRGFIDFALSRLKERLAQNGG